jgi:outer membrane immunogenic protein
MRFISAVAAFLLGLTLSAAGQGASSPAGPRADVALTYQYLHSNTQPGDCGCFNLNGAGLSASWRFFPSFAAVLETDADFASNGPGTGNSLTLISGVGGVRYNLPALLHHSRAPQFFAEAVAGGGHAGGGIAGAGDGGSGFVGRAGGGFDEVLAGPFALRFEAGYVPTTFANGGNDHQNNLLIATGLVYRWSRSR